MKKTMYTAVVASLAMLLSTTLGAQSKPAPGTPVGTTGSAAAPLRMSGPPTSAEYRLVPGDKLRIEVYKDAQLSQSLQVRPDGKITLPLLGDIAAAGRTALELRDSLATSLKEYNSNPVVTVIVVETVPPTIDVMGEVNSPGAQALIGEVNVIQALARAGGFKDFAKTSKIQVLRRGPSGTTTTLKFNYKDVVNGRTKAIVLQPGDTIIVP